MRKTLILAASIAIALLSISSCQKYSLSKGLYYADTKDGMIYLELMSGTDCVMFFQGSTEKDDGKYSISRGEITLRANANTKVGGRSVSWWFGGNLGTGIINGDSFKIQALRMYSTDLEYYYVTFYKL